MARKGIYPESVTPGIPRLGEKPEGWVETTFGEVLRVVKRPVQMDDDTEYQLVLAKRSRGGIVPRSRLLGRDIRTKTQFYIRTGDFLISKRQIIHGACGIVPPELDGAIVSNEYVTLRTREGLLPEYLRYFCHSVFFQQTCFQASVGVDVEKMIFDTKQWLKHKLYLPPLPEQHKTAQTVATWDEAMRLTEQLIDAAQRRKKALMQQLLTGNRRFMAPQGSDWQEVRLGDYIRTCKNGFGRRPLGSEEGPIVLRLADVSQGFIDLSSPRRVAMSPEEFQAYRLKEGDLLFIRVNGSPEYVARCVLVDQSYDDLAFNDHLTRARLKPGLSSRYLHQLLQYGPLRSRLLAFVPSSPGGQLTISQSSLSDLKIPLPSLEEQSRIAEILRLCDEDIDLLRHRLALLQEQKSGLMQRLLSGRSA